MATKSFTKEFAINRNNAHNVAKAMQQSKKVTLSIDKMVTEGNKDTIKNFFGTK